MIRKCLNATFCLIAFCAIPAVRCQEISSIYRLLPWQHPTIFLAQIEEVGSGSSAIRAKALKVWKDDYHQGLAPGEFSAAPIAAYDFEGNLEAGKSYLVLSRRAGGFGAALDDPQALILDSAYSDYADELETIVHLASLPLSDQAHQVSLLIANPAKPCLSYLARYAVTILATGTDAQSRELAQALESSPDRAFSDDAKVSLLMESWLQLTASSNAPASNLLEAFSRLTMRYFLSATGKTPGMTGPIEATVLMKCWPALKAVKGGVESFRANARENEVFQVQARLRQLIENGVRGPEAANSKEFLSFLQAQ